MFLIKNLSQFNNKPQRFKDHIFQRLFKVSEISKFTPKQITSYEDSSKQYRDLQNSFETARDEAMADGRAKVLKKGLQQGIEQGIGNEKLNVVNTNENRWS